MRFAVIIDGEVDAIHETHDGAYKDRLERDDFNGCHVQPIMTLNEWLATHTDFRGLLNGQPGVTYFIEGTGTVYGPAYLIERWDAYQITRKAGNRNERYENLIVRTSGKEERA